MYPVLAESLCHKLGIVCHQEQLLDGRSVVVTGDDFTVRGGSAEARIPAKSRYPEQMARELRLPMVVTEQYPEKLGVTINSVREAAGFPAAIGKLRFSACTEQTLAAIESSGRKTVLLCGVEAHVCVLQTALDLRERGYQVFAARDALSSRTPENAQIGWERMQSAGVLPTSTESALFELLEEAGTPDFKAILPLIK